ncbi:hypothetical protein [Klebsiella aerogenes]|nr:hypothetical protein [Klebsiella aerogenes]
MNILMVLLFGLPAPVFPQHMRPSNFLFLPLAAQPALEPFI